MLIKLNRLEFQTESDDETIDLIEVASGLPEGAVFVGANTSGELIFTWPKSKAPTGYTKATTADLEGMPGLESLKAQVNADRDSYINKGVMVEGIGHFDTDQVSQVRIAGALLLSSMPMILAQNAALIAMAEAAGDTITAKVLRDSAEAVQVPYILSDNTSKMLKQADLVKIGQAVAEHVAAPVHAARTVKDGLPALFAERLGA